MKKIQLSQIQYHVAYRKKEKGEYKEQFIVIRNNHNTWTADPFLFEYQNKTYIFAEMWMYRLGRGVIGYSVWNGKHFSKWHPIIEEDYHLSYPNVFQIGNEIFMCPESSETGEIYLYKAINFPKKWEKSTILCSGGKYVDTTFFMYNQDAYGFTYRLSPGKDDANGELLWFKIKDGMIDFCKDNPVTEDDSIARPAGKCICKNGKIYRVSQDCKESYGHGLVFSEMFIGSNKYKEKAVKKYYPEDFNLSKKLNCIGVHTFNQSTDFQVIDLRSRDISLKLLLFRIYNKIMKIRARG